MFKRFWTILSLGAPGCLTNLCDASSRWDYIFIHIFRTVQATTRSRLNLDLPQIDIWHEFHSRKAVLKASGTSFSGREAAELSTKSRYMSLRAASHIFNKEKDFFESLKYYLKM